MLTQSEIFDRLGLSDNFWKQIKIPNPTLKKQVGLYEIGSIDNATLITAAVNPKEYFQKHRNREINKKYKGLKKDTDGMSFETFAQRIMSLNESYSYKIAKPKKKIIQRRLQDTDMQMVNVKKTHFAGLNDMRFYFYDGIVSLPFAHPLLEEVKKEKKDLKKSIHQVINEKNFELL